MWLDSNNILFKMACNLFGTRDWMKMGHNGVQRV